jgi:transforming growth factor-beta-induced protein
MSPCPHAQFRFHNPAILTTIFILISFGKQQKGGKGGSSKSGKGGSKSSKASKASKSSKASKASKSGKEVTHENPVNYTPVNPPTDPPAAVEAGATSISSFVSGNSDLSILLQALGRAGFLGILDTGGPFTLFAPSNSAFTAIPEAFVNILFVNDDFIPHLQNLLLYHIAFGEFFASDLALLSGDNLMTANLENQPILYTAPSLTINGVPVMVPNNGVTNGVIQIIDEVLAPSWVGNSITSRLAAATDLSILSQLLVLATFDLSGLGGAFTLLSPTNAAFNALPAGALDFLSDADNIGELQTIMAYHLVLGVYTAVELQDGLQLPTILEPLTVVVTVTSPTTLFFNNASLGDFDILAYNGVVHKIATVLNPADSPIQR